MAKAKIDQKDARVVITKLRKIAGARSDFTFSHERTRATKTRAENNVYSLSRKGKALVSVHTNLGVVAYVANIVTAVK